MCKFIMIKLFTRKMIDCSNVVTRSDNIFIPHIVGATPTVIFLNF